MSCITKYKMVSVNAVYESDSFVEKNMYRDLLERLRQAGYPTEDVLFNDAKANFAEDYTIEELPDAVRKAIVEIFIYVYRLAGAVVLLMEY